MGIVRRVARRWRDRKIQAGDSDGAFEIYQSEDGAVGSIAKMQGGTVCDTKGGAKECFYVLRVPDREDVEEDETVGLALKLQKKVRNHQSEQSVETGMMPDFNTYKFFRK